MAADSRKRAAPGNTPSAQQAAQQGPYGGVTDFSSLSNDQFLSWGNNNNSVPSFADTGGIFGGVAGVSDPPYQAPPDGTPSLQHSNSQLVRRNLNRELTVRGRNDLAGQQQDMWPTYGLDGSTGPVVNMVEDNDDLAERAAAAQRDAQSKRPPKQIPPFIQKLSSFLDESRNTDLIRWSDDGNSFIVIDEDRFANELIPELFKHNNYASFVRQLNMYGFHKNVGLSDNSMRASETKAKRPSVYSNPYFKRGRPELLWLIQKPKNETAAAKKKRLGKTGEQAQDSDDDVKDVTDVPSKMDVAQVSPTAFAGMQREIAQLQKNQQQILGILTRMRDENNQYVRQAATMVAAHERHENSINAILTFLATFYNRSMDNPGNLGTMFSNNVPNNQQQHGNIVDMGDFDGGAPTPDPSQMQVVRTPARRPLALLPPPEPHSRPASNIEQSEPSSRATTSTPTASTQRISKTPAPASNNAAGANRASSVSSSNGLANGVDDIMNVINNANGAANTNSQTNDPHFDFNTLQNANGQTPLTTEQRNSLLSMMASNSGTETPQIPLGGEGVNPWAQGLQHFQQNTDQIDLLQRMQEEQDYKMADLADRLQPLSPSGMIPGFNLGDLASPRLSRTSSLNLGGMGPPNTHPGQQTTIPNLKAAPSSDFDINKFLNTDYLPDGDDNMEHFGDNPDGFNFDSPYGGDQHDGNKVTDATPPGLFDDANDDTNMSEFLNNDNEGQSGRVIGSVASSIAGSAVNSPKVKTEDEDEAVPTTKADSMPNRKRRRVGE